MVLGHFSTAMIPFLLVACLTVGHPLNSLPSWRVYPRVFPATGSAFLTRCSPAGGNQLEFNVWKVHAPVGHQPTYTETLVGDPCLCRGSGAPSQTLSFVMPTHVLTHGCGGKMSHEVIIDFFTYLHVCMCPCMHARARVWRSEDEDNSMDPVLSNYLKSVLGIKFRLSGLWSKVPSPTKPSHWPLMK